MEVVVDNRVYQVFEEFYMNALLNHPTLDENTVMNKIQRLRKALSLLGHYATAFPIARLKSDWIALGYREYIVEDFHFAYQVYKKESGECIVRVHDACHSLLYHS